METNSIQLFENQPNRAAWDEEKEEWYFSIVDVMRILTESPNPQTYWRVMKKRLKDEGNETVTNCNALKMTACSKYPLSNSDFGKYLIYSAATSPKNRKCTKY